MTGDSYNLADAITASDSVNLGRGVCDALYVGSVAGGATLAVVLENDSVASFTVAAGLILPIRAKRVNSTGTLASALMALYVV